MRLDDLNALDPDAAVAAFLRCCHSRRWAASMTAARPFRNEEELSAASDRIWRALEARDWLEAFGGHPRIGEPPPASRGRATSDRPTASGSADWAAQEQARAGSASDATRARLAEANRAYEARFGYIFIVCASGRTADEMLDLLERRMTNAPGDELNVAAEEQRKITRLRLSKLLSDQAAP